MSWSYRSWDTMYGMNSPACVPNDSGLERFVVEGKATGRHLGQGCYGSVEEVSRATDSYLITSLAIVAIIIISYNI